MAKAKTSINLAQFKSKSKTRRKGVHAKTKMSKNKNSSLYVKPKVAQG